MEREREKIVCVCWISEPTTNPPPPPQAKKNKQQKHTHKPPPPKKQTPTNQPKNNLKMIPLECEQK